MKDEDIHKVDSEELILRYQRNQFFGRIKLLPILARRAESDSLVLEMMSDEILSIENRQLKAVGFVKFAWLHALYLLEIDDIDLSNHVYNLLNKWSLDERELFYNYAHKDSIISKHIHKLELT